MTSKQMFRCARWAMLVMLPCAAPCQGPTRAEASNAWAIVMRDVAALPAFVRFDYVPEPQYSNLTAMARHWQKMEYEPSRTEVEKSWKEHGRNDKELTDEMSVRVSQFLRQEKFRVEHKSAIDEIRTAAGKKLYERLVADGIVDQKSPACFVFVPLPCPSQQIYARATSFIGSACRAAQERHLSVVIVRSYYGKEESVKKPLTRGDSWNDEILGMPTQYAESIESGTVKLVDSFPGGTTTPWGFLFRGGELVLDGNAATWAAEPQSILAEFKP